MIEFIAVKGTITTGNKKEYSGGKDEGVEKEKFRKIYFGKGNR